LRKDHLVALLLLAFALFALPFLHLLAIGLAVEDLDVQTGEGSGEELLQNREELGIRSVGAGVVVDDEFVV